MRARAGRFLVIGILSFAGSPAFGQAVDPNIQVRIETALPQPVIKPHLPETERITVQRTETFTTMVERPYTCGELRSPSPECQSAPKFDPSYCRIYECYPDGAIADGDPMSID